MSPACSFEVLARDRTSAARAGVLHTPHGDVETPIFMPVGTAGTVKGMSQDLLEQIGAQIILANTYHLYLRPGHELIRELGGLHKFMSWPRPILTDSGGYQVMSLKGLGRVREDGFEFRSHLDGSPHTLSPEKAVEIQWALGSDIIMVLDECVEYPATHERLHRALKLTSRWAKRSKERYDEIRKSQNARSALFGIVQGGTDIDLRRESTEEILNIGFDGYALGGLSVGEAKNETYDVVEATTELLPQDRPRYLMGVGTPEDLVECVARGVDMFDCVMPTRNARNGCAFTSEGKITVKNLRFACDESPLDPSCACPVCRRYSRAYLRHLFLAGEMLAGILTTCHNLYFYLDTMGKIRQALKSGNFEKFRSGKRGVT